MKAPREAATLRGVLDYLRLKGIFAWRSSNHAARRRDARGREFWAFSGLAGTSDILGVLGPLPDGTGGGRILCVEVKRPGGKLTPAQSIFLDTVRRLGGLSVVVESVGDLVAALKAAGY